MMFKTLVSSVKLLPLNLIALLVCRYLQNYCLNFNLQKLYSWIKYIEKQLFLLNGFMLFFSFCITDMYKSYIAKSVFLCYVSDIFLQTKDTFFQVFSNQTTWKNVTEERLKPIRKIYFLGLKIWKRQISFFGVVLSLYNNSFFQQQLENL